MVVGRHEGRRDGGGRCRAGVPGARPPARPRRRGRGGRRRRLLHQPLAEPRRPARTWPWSRAPSSTPPSSTSSSRAPSPSSTPRRCGQPPLRPPRAAAATTRSTPPARCRPSRPPPAGLGPGRRTDALATPVVPGLLDAAACGRPLTIYGSVAPSGVRRGSVRPSPRGEPIPFLAGLARLMASSTKSRAVLPSRSQCSRRARTATRRRVWR